MDPAPAYLDDEYERKLHELVDELDGTPFTAAETIFLDECKSLRGELQDDTPIDVIRQAAYSNTRSHFRNLKRS